MKKDIKIRYNSRAFETMMNRVEISDCYTVEEKECLGKMLHQMKREDWVLYMVELYREEQFDFSIVF